MVQSVVSFLLQFTVVKAAFQRTETGVCSIGVIVGLKGTLKSAQLTYGFSVMESRKQEGNF